MTVVSKFRISHILSGVLVAMIPGFFLGIIGATFVAIRWEFEYSYIAGYVTGIFGFIFFLFTF